MIRRCSDSRFVLGVPLDPLSPINPLYMAPGSGAGDESELDACSDNWTRPRHVPLFGQKATR